MMSFWLLLTVVQFHLNNVFGLSNRNGKFTGVNITVDGSGIAFVGKPYQLNLFTDVLNASKWIIDWGDWTQTVLPGESDEVV